MKKLLASIIVLFYLMVSTGFIVSMHYCMDRFDSAELGAATTNKCDKCGMQKHDGCCHDIVKVVKLQTVHITSASINPDFSLADVHIITSDFLFQPLRNFISHSESFDHGPPLINERDIYLQNCVFRI